MRFTIKEVSVSGHAEAPALIGHLECAGYLDYQGTGAQFTFWSCVEIGENPHSHETLSLGPTQAHRMPVATYNRAIQELKQFLWSGLRPGDAPGDVVDSLPGRLEHEGNLIRIQLDEPYPVVRVH